MNLREKLEAPFEYDELEWRAQRVGSSAKGPWAMVLAYVQNRAIMNRLDDVFGLHGWQNEFQPIEHGFLCGIGILDDHMGGINEWIWKWDGAQETDIEATKGGISNSMKRCAVQFGIGRYLYKLDTTFAICCESIPQGEDRSLYVKAKTQDGKYFFWKKPSLPEWALPQKEEPKKKETKKTSKEPKPEPEAAPEIKPEVKAEPAQQELIPDKETAEPETAEPETAMKLTVPAPTRPYIGDDRVSKIKMAFKSFDITLEHLESACGFKKETWDDGMANGFLLPWYQQIQQGDTELAEKIKG